MRADPRTLRVAMKFMTRFCITRRPYELLCLLTITVFSYSCYLHVYHALGPIYLAQPSSAHARESAAEEILGDNAINRFASMSVPWSSTPKNCMYACCHPPPKSVLTTASPCITLSFPLRQIRLCLDVYTSRCDSVSDYDRWFVSSFALVFLIEVN